MIDCGKKCEVAGGYEYRTDTKCMECLRTQLHSLEESNERLAEKHCETVVKYGAKVVEIAELNGEVERLLGAIKDIDESCYTMDDVKITVEEAINGPTQCNCDECSEARKDV